MHLKVSTDVIRMPDAHGEDVSRETQHHAHHHLGFQVGSVIK